MATTTTTTKQPCSACDPCTGTAVDCTPECPGFPPGVAPCPGCNGYPHAAHFQYNDDGTPSGACAHIATPEEVAAAIDAFQRTPQGSRDGRGSGPYYPDDPPAMPAPRGYSEPCDEPTADGAPCPGWGYLRADNGWQYTGPHTCHMGDPE